MTRSSRLVKRLHPTTGLPQVVVKHHPGGQDHDQQSHGRRHEVGIGSQAAILSLLQASHDRRQGPDITRLRQLDDIAAWEGAKQQYGSYEAVHAALESLPHRGEGEALRAGDVPDSALPDPARAAAERQRLGGLKTADGRPAKLLLHGTGTDGKQYAVPVVTDADIASAGGRYLLAPGVESVGSVRRERI